MTPQRGLTPMLLLALLLASPLTLLAAAHQAAFGVPSVPNGKGSKADPEDAAAWHRRPRSVAIVGAGASGASAAFFLRRAANVAEQRAGVEPGTFLDNIDVFEKEGYVGGRSTTVYPHNDTRFRPVELGASIFVGANENLVKTAKLFNLSAVDPGFSEAGIGIWDGLGFLFTTTTSKSRWSGWWDTISALKRYGPLSPYRQNKAVAKLVDNFRRLYDSAWLNERGTVASIEDFAKTVELGEEFTTRTGIDWARNEVGVGERWADEIIEGSTRVNYARDIDQIHALGAGVSLATGEASSIEGGNWRIFDGMLKDSGARMFLDHVVTDIQAAPANVPTTGKWNYRVVSSGPLSDEVDEYGEPLSDERVINGWHYDEVFFAAPWHDSPIYKGYLEAAFPRPIPEQEYVELHVTLIATTAPTPYPAYFKLKPDVILPKTIITSGSAYRADPAAPRPEFQSISYHGETYEGSGEYIVKLFSLAPLDEYTLTLIFGVEPTWIHRKVWKSYPALKPISAYAPVEPLPGFHYLAALEPWVSTMETQTISAREAVARTAERWWNLLPGDCGDGGQGWDMTCEDE